MTDLSPVAQAVWDAVRIHWEEWPEKDQRWRIACSIRAVADQVVPYEQLKGCDQEAWTRDAIRQDILDIAAELEAQ
jgi:hypothetical protein